jgi:putative FmdB family regulatory protein
MPIFEYKCDDCGNQFEKIVRRAGAEPPACPSCSGEQVKQQLSTFAAHSGNGGSSQDVPMCPSGGVCPTPGACGMN